MNIRKHDECIQAKIHIWYKQTAEMISLAHYVERLIWHDLIIYAMLLLSVDVCEMFIWFQFDCAICRIQGSWYVLKWKKNVWIIYTVCESESWNVWVFFFPKSLISNYLHIRLLMWQIFVIKLFSNSWMCKGVVDINHLIPYNIWPHVPYTKNR